MTRRRENIAFGAVFMRQRPSSVSPRNSRPYPASPTIIAKNRLMNSRNGTLTSTWSYPGSTPVNENSARMGRTHRGTVISVGASLGSSTSSTNNPQPCACAAISTEGSLGAGQNPRTTARGPVIAEPARARSNARRSSAGAIEARTASRCPARARSSTSVSSRSDDSRARRARSSAGASPGRAKGSAAAEPSPRLAPASASGGPTNATRRSRPRRPSSLTTTSSGCAGDQRAGTCNSRTSTPWRASSGSARGSKSPRGARRSSSRATSDCSCPIRSSRCDNASTRSTRAATLPSGAGADAGPVPVGGAVRCRTSSAARAPSTRARACATPSASPAGSTARCRAPRSWSSARERSC